MKPDLYTKAVLTVIAVMLSAIAVNQFVRPTSIVAAAASPQGDDHMSARTQIDFAAVDGRYFFYEVGTNTIRTYGPEGNAERLIHLHGNPTAIIP